MPTTPGWTVLGFSAGLLSLWVLLGEAELLAAGLLLTLAFLIAVGWVQLTDPALPVAREVNPEQVEEGEDVVITLQVTNPRRVPVIGLRVSDAIATLGSSTATIARVPGRTTVRVPYRIRTTTRGVFRVGPVELTVTDPLGLVARTTLAGPSDTLIVYPRTDSLSGFPIVRGRDPSVQASRPEFSARGGEDFFTIREYRHGDDLRRVHWRTTARRDELMIRQFETPWQSRGLVLFDVRTSAFDDENFESAVRAAASVYLHLRRQGFELDAVIGTEHIQSSDPGSTRRVLEALAGVQTARIDVKAVVARIRRQFTGGALVVVTGRIDESLGGAIAALAPDFGSVSVLAAHEGPVGALPALRTPAAAASAGPDEAWTQAWLSVRGRAWASA